MNTRLRDVAGDARGRGTAQKSAVLEVLGGSARFRTAQDIFSELRARGDRIGLTTVYRHLQRMAEDGTIHAVQLSDRQTAYRLCSGEKHHHLVCMLCGEGIELTDSEVDAWVNAEASHRGYTEVTHSVEIFGVCPTCAEGESASRPSTSAG